jgi:hypothetical protein
LPNYYKLYSSQRGLPLSIAGDTRLQRHSGTRNAFTDLTARKTAEQSIPPPILFLSSSFTPNYEPKEQTALLKEGGIMSLNGWIFKDNHLILPLGQTTEVITAIHNSLHIGPKALLSF